MPKENLRVVLLDDWTISGSQLRDVYHSLVDQYPEIEDQIEMQLIVANEQRIKYGLSVDELMGDGKKFPLERISRHTILKQQRTELISLGFILLLTTISRS